MDCRRAKEDEDEDEEEEDGEMRVCSATIKIWIPYVYVFYTLVIVLGASKQALAGFSNPRKALKIVFGVRSIRVFSKFSLDPYYEPLLWFMIMEVITT